MTARSNWHQSFGLRDAGVYYALGLLLALLAGLAAARGLPPYLSAGNLGNITYQATLVGIMGVAMTVLLITGAFDLSVASVAALAAVVVVGLAPTLGFPMAAGAALTTAMAVGIFNGIIVQFVGINAFIVTLGSLTAVRGLVLVLTGGRSLMVERPEVLQAMLAFEFEQGCDIRACPDLSFPARRIRPLTSPAGNSRGRTCHRSARVDRGPGVHDCRSRRLSRDLYYYRMGRASIHCDGKADLRGRRQ